MKNLTILLLAVLTLSVNPVLAQRGANQSLFKQNSRTNYEYNNFLQNDEDKVTANFDLNGRRNTNKAESRGGLIAGRSSQLIFEAQALMNVTADSYLAVFNLTQVGKTAKETNQLINKRIDGFLSDLKALSISDGDAYTDMIYLIPTFEFEVQKKLFSSDTYVEVPSGFEMQKNVHVAFRDINLVDDMVTLAAENEIYDLVKLDFFVQNTEQIYDSLRERTQQYLTKTIISHAQSQRINLLDEFHTVDESTKAIYPDGQYSDFEAYVSQSLDAAQGKAGVSKIRKPKTVAYDQIPYDDFDIVINPNILGPVVQFTFSMKVRFLLEKEKEAEDQKYFMVTPDGQLRELQIKGN